MQKLTSLLSVGLFAGFVTAGPLQVSDKAAARQEKKVVAEERKVAHATEIAELKATRALLERADHDYKGHRAAAVKEITAAIQHLEGSPPATKAARKAEAKKEAAKGGNNEPQPVSDAQLREAAKGLAVIQKQLAATGGARAGKAAISLEKAGKELGIALSIK